MRHPIARDAVTLLAIALAALALTIAPPAGTPTARADSLLATVNVGSAPQGVAITPDGTRAYVSKGGTSGSGTVSVINTANNAVTNTITVGNQPQGVAIAPNGTRAYVANYGPDTVSVINTADNTIAGTISVDNTAGSPRSVAITPNSARAYITIDGFFGTGQVVVADTTTNKLIGNPINVGNEPQGVAITPDGARAYVANSGSGSVSVIDTATNTVIGSPIIVGNEPQGVAITPDGTRAYVTKIGSGSTGTVSVIDTTTNTVLAAAIPVGNSPAGVAITPDGARAYVANTGPDSVSVIDTATNTVIGSPITVGSNPLRLAITPNGTRAYVANSGSGSVSVIQIGNAPTLTGTPPPGKVGDPYSHPFAATGYPAPTVTATAGNLPPGLALAPNGVLSGTPTQGGTFDFTLTASNGILPNAILPVTLTVNASPTITGDAPDGVVNQDYSYPFTLTGAPAPTVTVTAGALPPGLNIAGNGVLSGIPTEAGDFTFTLTAANGIDPPGTLEVTLTVNASPTITGDAPDGVVNQDYSYAFTVTGAPAPTVTVTAGALPPGLNIAGNGVLSGIPTEAGDFTFTLTAANGIDPPGTLPVTLTVNASPTITGDAPDGVVNQDYSYAFTVTGAPAPTVTVTTGALPPGLNIAPTGELTGTPTQAGTFNFTLTATNNIDPPGTLPVTLTVNASPTITGDAPDGVVNQDYSYAFTVTGAPAPTVTVTTGALPPGLNIAPTGELTGTPTQAGTFNFTLTATNNIDPPATLPVALTVNAAPTITGDPPDGTVDRLYIYAFLVTGAPAPTVTVTTGALPPGLTLAPTGELTGTPTQAGESTFTLTATNGIEPPATLTVTLTIDLRSAPTITGDPPDGVVNQSYNYPFTVTGAPTPIVTVTAGDLPPGLTIDPTTGVLSGTPTTAGTSTFTLTAANGIEPPATVTATLTITPPPTITAPPTISGTPPGGVVNQAYTHTFTLTGTPTPTVTAPAGDLPPGLTLAPNGTLSGTPTRAGEFTFTATAGNGIEPPATLRVILTIAEDCGGSAGSNGSGSNCNGSGNGSNGSNGSGNPALAANGFTGPQTHWVTLADGTQRQVLYSRDQVETQPSRIDAADNWLAAHGLTQSLVAPLLTQPAGSLNPIEREILFWYRHTIPDPAAGQVLQAVTDTAQKDTRLTNTDPHQKPGEVIGLVTAARDTINLTNTAALRDGLALDYAGSPYAPQTPIYAMRFTLSNHDQLHIPDAQPANPHPRTGTGFTASNHHVIPEYFVGSQTPMNPGAEMYRIDPNGTETLIAVLTDQGKWITVKN